MGKHGHDRRKHHQHHGYRRRAQTVLTVERVEWLTARMVRVLAGGPGFSDFHDNGCTDHHVKIWFVRPQLGLTPPYDVDELRKRLERRDLPVRRTYTVRRVDPLTRTLALDFVVHGEEGVAGPWAASAKPGDTVAFTGPGGTYAPRPDADWHLFVGDESAAPAIGAALDALPPDATGMAYLEVENDALAPPVSAPGGVRVVLVRRDGAGNDPARLADAVAAGAWPAGDVQVFAHGERESMKRLRPLLEERHVDKHRVSLSGYWTYGRGKDRFSAATARSSRVERRGPDGRI